MIPVFNSSSNTIISPRLTLHKKFMEVYTLSRSSPLDPFIIQFEFYENSCIPWKDGGEAEAAPRLRRGAPGADAERLCFTRPGGTWTFVEMQWKFMIFMEIALGSLENV